MARGKTDKSILDFVPKGWTLRPDQAEILLKIEANLDAADVFLVNLPVAWGKTILAQVVAPWLSWLKKWKGAILDFDNQLLEQRLASFPNTHTLRKKSTYECELYANQTVKFSCEQHVKLTTKTGPRGGCIKGTYCSGCPYTTALKRSRVYPWGAYTAHAYLANKLQGEYLIVDEAHKLVDFIKDLSGKKLWRKEYNFPHYLRTYSQLYHWVKSNPRLKTDRKLQLLKQELEQNRVNYLAQRTVDKLRGVDEECIKLLPVDVRTAPPFLWPGKTKKVFLLSGTISAKTAEDMGLGNRRLCIINAASPIPVERRPIVCDLLFNMSAANEDRDLPGLAQYIRNVLAAEPGRGFIHAPYALATKLRAILSDEPRIMGHGRDDKRAAFAEWRESVDGVFIASGMYEGVSLDGDTAHWQLITKIPFDSLGEPAIRYQMDNDIESYMNSAATKVMQAYGRICRTPTDQGITIVTDKAFERMYLNFPHLFADWFKAAVEDSAWWQGRSGDGGQT